MRPMLRWGLAATAFASAAALWVGDKSSDVVAAVERTVVGPRIPEAVAVAQHSTEPLPQALEPLTIEPARRDVFAPVQPPAPPAPLPPKPFVGPPLPPPPPAPPPVNWRYLGSMTTPVGQRLVMLARGDNSAVVEPGAVLDDGYVVQAIGSDAVRLVYPPLGTVVDLPVPPTSPSSR